MAKQLMAGKTAKSKGKKLSHGNSHVSAQEVRWDTLKEKSVINDK
jgi:hypothetical protein